MTYLRGVPGHGWYDPPDEPSDAAYEDCYTAWREYLEDYCETCEWAAVDAHDDGNSPHLATEPCAACEADPPAKYDDEWQQRWFDDRERDA